MVSRAVFEFLGVEWDGYGILSNIYFGIKDADHLAYRAAPKLISAIESVGVKTASGEWAELRIVNVPDDVMWEIDNHAGKETVRDFSRSWG